jgi:hypothetical protein
VLLFPAGGCALGLGGAVFAGVFTVGGGVFTAGGGVFTFGGGVFPGVYPLFGLVFFVGFCVQYREFSFRYVVFPLTLPLGGWLGLFGVFGVLG